MPIPKPKRVHIILDNKEGGGVYEALEQAGVKMGEPREHGAPNLFYGCLVPPGEAQQLLDELFDQGELLYGYD